MRMTGTLPSPEDSGAAPKSGVSYYTVADARFFVGVVALLNSLRLTGNQGDLFVLDFGLLPDQRRRLAAQAHVVDIPDHLSDNPVLAKPFPHVLGAAGIVVVIDSDVIVTSSFQRMVTVAEQGKICVFPVTPGHRGRWFAEWEQLFGLRGPPRKQQYRSGGCVTFSAARWPEFLARWYALSEQIPSQRTTQRGASIDDPFWGAEQDALNALLMTEVDPDAVADMAAEDGIIEDELHQVRIDDVATLECTIRGRSPMWLHYGGGPKPWESAAWMRVRRNAFVVLMTRVLFAEDVALRLDPREVPLWLRPGPAGRAALAMLSIVNASARFVVRRSSGRAERGLARLRDRLGPR